MSGTGVFAAATSVEQMSAAEGDGAHTAFSASINDGWDIGGNANGGYLMAIAGRAMAEAVGRPPLTLTAHYLRPAPAGPCTIDVDMVRSGRRLATARASLRIGGKSSLELLGTFGDQQPDDGPTYEREAPVHVTPYVECPIMSEAAEAAGPALMDRLASRIDPVDIGFRSGKVTGDPTVRGWFALAGDEPIDAIALLLAADAFPPPIFNSGMPVAWVPTVELTVHIRGTPAPGPIRCAFRSRFIHDGLVDEEGEMWDSTGALIAQSRQLSLTPRG
jgi:acyl-CoA thioesterase